MRYSENVISAFLTNSRKSDIARACNLSRTTIVRYSKDPELQRVLSERRSEMLQQTSDKLWSMLSADADGLLEVLDDPQTIGQTKINCINAIFQNFKLLYETACLEKRVAELETQKVEIVTLLNNIPRGGDGK